MSNKPKTRLSLHQLFYLSIGGFGLQLASSLEMNNTSGIFKFLGATELQIGWLWLIAPITGMIIQPVLGQLSDLIETPKGKRMPFIVAGFSFASASLLLLAFSERLWLATSLLLILSCSLNCATEGLRALLGDITPDQQKPAAFAWQAVWSSGGAMLASLLPWLLEQLHIFANGAIVRYQVPVVIKFSLLLGGLMLFQSFWLLRQNINERAIRDEITAENASLSSVTKPSWGTLLLQVGLELAHNLRTTPQVIRKLFVVQLFTWAGIFGVWLYLGIALAQHVYGLPASSDGYLTPHSQLLLQEGMVANGVAAAISQIFSIIYVLILPKLVEKISPYRVHACSLLIGALSLILLSLFYQLWPIYILMAGFGMMWGSLLTLPYAIIAAELPSEKMGTYMGVFNLTVTIPQIICGLLIGVINHYIFFNHAIFTVILSGLFIAIAGVLLLKHDGIDVWQWLTRRARRMYFFMQAWSRHH